MRGTGGIIGWSVGGWIVKFYEWKRILVVLMGCGLVSVGCVDFVFKERLEAERRLKVNFEEVLRV